MYKLIRKTLFLFPPEEVHYFSMNLLKWVCSIPLIRNGIARRFTPANQTVPAFGLAFRNPAGLGAGFDKNARYLRELEALGFGFVEIGTVTPRPQAGNKKPRVFRLPEDQALINRMGFNNDGMEKISGRLAAWRKNPSPMLVGGNIGKNRDTSNEDAWKDYLACFTVLHPYVDFFVVNVSSPNTPGLRELQDSQALKKILTALQEKNSSLARPRPILLKIAPDLELRQIDEVLQMADEISLDGIVATNTTISRESLVTPEKRISEIGAGGLSGRPLRERSTGILKYIHDKTGGSIPLVGSGGIFTAGHLREKMEAGAILAEVWTGFVYEGPGIIRRILQGL